MQSKYVNLKGVVLVRRALVGGSRLIRNSSDLLLLIALSAADLDSWTETCINDEQGR